MKNFKKGNIIKFIRWRNYDKDDYRIEQYCKAECSYCLTDRNNEQAFCYGEFKRLKDGAYFRGAGAECTKTINICFNKNFKLIER